MSRFFIMQHLLVLLTFSAINVDGQSTSAKVNSRYAFKSHSYLLSSLFPVDDIVSVTVENFRGKHKLTNAELSYLKQQLTLARAFGGLEQKPGHIILHIVLKSNSKVKLGYTYGSTGSIHFERAELNGKSFAGTYFLPVDLNFDNY